MVAKLVAEVEVAATTTKEATQGAGLVEVAEVAPFAPTIRINQNHSIQGRTTDLEETMMTEANQAAPEVTVVIVDHIVEATTVQMEARATAVEVKQVAATTARVTIVAVDNLIVTVTLAVTTIKK
jgi:hypothetical protein